MLLFFPSGCDVPSTSAEAPSTLMLISVFQCVHSETLVPVRAEFLACMNQLCAEQDSFGGLQVP